jgi:putative pyoverdin transport system ATP-binding/permease protein
MKLLQLLRRESAVSLRWLLLLAALAGISSALVLAVINTSAGLAAPSTGGAGGTAEPPNTGRNALLFVVIMAIYAVSQWKLYSTATEEIEKILDRVRIRVADKVRRCDLMPMERLGQTVIYAGLTKDAQTVSQAGTLVIMSAQAAVLVVFTALYVAYLSLVAFVLTAGVAVMTSVLHLRRARRMSLAIHDLSVRENDLFDSLRHFLDGFKEVRMSRARSDDLFAHFSAISADTTARKCRTHGEIAQTFIFSQMSFYALLGVVVFLVPRFSQTHAGPVVNITAAVLFLMGPITTLVGTVPNLAIADAAVDNLASLEAALDKALSEGFDTPAPRTAFQEIEFEDVVFHYDATERGDAFSVGPINLSLKAGETVFVAGGNGSGKSTFLKLLTALYHPHQGVIRIDGKILRPDTGESYRSLFSTVFTDYHLFDRLYGLLDASQEAIDRAIEYVELTGKTQVVDGRFETLELSGGQRKRLALLVSLLEDRPIYVFDEMAADQDPAFRRKFYEEILPTLRRSGRTVVAVTHDDKYFGATDRLLKMEEGRIACDAVA